MPATSAVAAAALVLPIALVLVFSLLWFTHYVLAALCGWCASMGDIGAADVASVSAMHVGQRW